MNSSKCMNWYIIITCRACPHIVQQYSTSTAFFFHFYYLGSINWHVLMIPVHASIHINFQPQSSYKVKEFLHDLYHLKNFIFIPLLLKNQSFSSTWYFLLIFQHDIWKDKCQFWNVDKGKNSLFLPTNYSQFYTYKLFITWSTLVTAKCYLSQSLVVHV